jgi:hypothetical protein
MRTDQYIQHDWPPAVFALMLLAMAVFVVIGMGVFLIGANRELRGFTARHEPRDAQQPGRKDRAAGSARL